MLAWLDNTSMLCARVVRGAASSAKPVSPAVASFCSPAASKGLSIPTRVAPARMRGSSLSEGARTFSTSSAPSALAASVICAPTAW